MDQAERLVIPKAIREAAGLLPGRSLEITSEAGCVEIRHAPLAIEIRDAEDGLPLAVPKEPVATLTADMIRETVEAMRVDRLAHNNVEVVVPQ